jgi:sporulation protein YlmC with PRC-barrel domain
MYCGDRDTFAIHNDDAGAARAFKTESDKVSNEMTASTVVGSQVYNHRAEKLDYIDDILFDTSTSKISSAVLSFGGFLGIGEKYFSIPWGALTLDAEKHCFLLNVEKIHLSNSAGFKNFR